MTDQDWLDWRKSWWDRDRNPLHAWAAISICLSAVPVIPLPEWCAQYLAMTAKNLESLMRGQDFRDAQTTVTPNHAHELTAAALGFSSQGKKNVFARISDANNLSVHASRAEFSQDNTNAVSAIQRKRNIEPDSARRLLREGRKMTRRQV
jgi:hypothetical protein